MRTFTALAVICVSAFVATAQEEKTVAVTAYGKPAAEVIPGFCEQAGLELELRGVELEDFDVSCFMVANELSPRKGAELLAFSTGVPVRVDGSKLVLGSASGGVVKGYDVSVLAGAYVEYVNNYGAPKSEPEDGAEPAEDQTAAEHLADVVAYFLEHPYRAEISPSVVGDRVLLTLPTEDHARVRELLDLLMQEHGGESSALKSEREVRRKLGQAKFSGEFTGTPVSSVVLGICREAGLSVALGAELASTEADRHIDFVVKDEVSAAEALERFFRQLESDDVFIVLDSVAGAAAVEIRDFHVWSGYRVFDVSDLLRKLSASYQRQRTAAGKDGGFQGDLRQAGGNEVVVDAIYDQLIQQGVEAHIKAFGTRIVVGGGTEAVDAATIILEEMGWEPPKE